MGRQLAATVGSRVEMPTREEYTTGALARVAPFRAADQEVGFVAANPMRQASEWSTSLPSTPPK